MQEKQGGNSGIVAQFKRFFSGYSVIVITVILFIVAGIFQGQNFLSPQNIINVLRNNAVLGILALGMAFVIIVGEIDLSVGAELVIVASICLAVLNATQNIVLAVIVTMACAIGFSTGMGVIVAKGKVPSFVVTLGGMYIFRSVCQYFMGGGSLEISLMQLSGRSHYQSFIWQLYLSYICIFQNIQKWVVIFMQLVLMQEQRSYLV